MTALLPHAIENRNIDDAISTQIEQLKLYYPRGCQTISFRPECPVNGTSFLRELMRFGWDGAARGRTLHMTHPAADYQEA